MSPDFGDQYHPLFKDFLQSLADSTFTSEKVDKIKSDAALILEESEQFEGAIGLYLETKKWNDAVRLILNHSQLMVSQGMNLTLEGWLRRLPDSVFSSFSRLRKLLGKNCFISKDSTISINRKICWVDALA